MNNNYKSKFQFSLILMLISASLFAQIPNPGFENWTSGSCTPLFTTYNYNDPVSWGTINVLTCQGGAFTTTQSTDAHSGTYALQLTTVNVIIQTAPGICATGTINQNTQNIDGGFAINYRPSFLKGWFKYTPSGTDQFSVSVDFYTGTTISTNVIGSGSFTTSSTVGSYTEFTVPITYTSGAQVDSAQITILCSFPSQNTAQVGSTSLVDDLFFVDCSGFSAGHTAVNPTCTQSNGSIEMIPAGGTSPFGYNWSNGLTVPSTTGLAAGPYKITVSDANGCTTVDSVLLTATNIPFTVTTSSTTTSCVSNTGTLSVAASGGNSPYTYLWANSNTNDTISNLGAGNIGVTVTDAHGCSTTATGVVTTSSGPSATDTVTNINCFGDSTGQVTVTVSGGAAPLSYAWSNNATTVSLSNVTAGTYTLTINDVNNCSFSLSADVVQPATALSVAATVTNEECNGASTGSIVLTASGGTQAYTYTWSNSTTANAITNLASNLYRATVTDGNGCSTIISDSVTQPAALSIVLTEIDASGAGNNGSVSAAVSGGTGSYVYVWNTTSTHDTITHLSPATYCVTATDANHCSVSSCDSVSFVLGLANITESIVKIYPNPASDLLLVDPNTTEGKFHFSIFDMNGKAVTDRTITAGRISIDLKQFAEGLYTYQFVNLSSGKIDSGKLQILR